MAVINIDLRQYITVCGPNRSYGFIVYVISSVYCNLGMFVDIL